MKMAVTKKIFGTFPSRRQENCLKLKSLSLSLSQRYYFLVNPTRCVESVQAYIRFNVEGEGKDEIKYKLGDEDK